MIKKWFFLLPATIILIFSAFYSCENKKESHPIQKPDSFTNHDYSKYKFSDDKNVINIGTQPLYLPTGLVTEAMKRDNILREALAKLGMRVTFYAFLKGADVNNFLSKGFLAGGVGGDMPAISAASSMDIIIPSLIQWGYTSIVANRDIQIRDLRGKKIGYAIGSNAHYTLLHALEINTITEKDVNLIPMDVNDMAVALNTEQIDAFSAWEPTVTIALTKDPKNKVIHKNLSSGYLYFLRKGSSENYMEAVKQIVASEIRALLWMRSSGSIRLQTTEWAIQECEKLLGRRFELSAEQTLKLAEKDLVGLYIEPFIRRHDLKPNRRLQMEFKLLKTIGKLPRTSNWEKVRNSFDYLIMTEILENHKRYATDEFRYDINED